MYWNLFVLFVVMDDKGVQPPIYTPETEDMVKSSNEDPVDWEQMIFFFF